MKHGAVISLGACYSGAPGGMPPEEMVKLVRSEIVKWAKVIKDAGAKIDN